MIHIDIHTISHFLGGLVSSFVVFPDKPVLSFFISNLLHLVSELHEVKIDPYSKQQLETYQNNLGDIIAYLLGWILGFILINKVKIKISKPVYYILLVLFILGFIKEFLREFLIRKGYGKQLRDTKSNLYKLLSVV